MILQHDTHAFDGLRAVAPMVRGGMPRLQQPDNAVLPCQYYYQEHAHITYAHTHTGHVRIRLPHIVTWQELVVALTEPERAS